MALSDAQKKAQARMLCQREYGFDPEAIIRQETRSRQ